MLAKAIKDITHPSPPVQPQAQPVVPITPAVVQQPREIGPALDAPAPAAQLSPAIIASNWYKRYTHS